MPPDITYIEGPTARALWFEWTEALSVRVDHELVCRLVGGGCDTRGQFCLIGADLQEIEQAAHRAYSEYVDDLEVAA